MSTVPSRWIKSPADELAVSEGCWFDERAAMRPVLFFSKFLRHSKGQWAGKPFELLDWQREDIVMPLFGWMRRRDDGLIVRRFKEADIYIPKKNGKSTLCAGLALFGIEADGEASAEVYGAAADRHQGAIVYEEAVNMVKASALLAERLTLVESRKRITAPITRGWYQVLSADAFRSEGINAHFVIFDELHAQPDRRLHDALKYAGAARRQSLSVYISTAGEDKENSICGERWSYAEEILKGNVKDTRVLCYIRAAENKDDWQKPETWAKANPSWGITIAAEDMAAATAEAVRKPASRASFKRYRLNIWAEGGEDPWLNLDLWDKARGKIDVAALAGKTCTGGLDHSDTLDLTALSLWFPDDPDSAETWAKAGTLLQWFWCPEARIRDRAASDKVPYDQWSRDGHLIATEGDVVDFSVMWQKLGWARDTFNLASLRVDPWNATATLNHCQAENIPARKFRQGIFTLSEPSKQLESAIIEGLIRHDGNPCMRWMVGNVRAKEDASGNIRPVKPPRRDRKRIDGIVAAIMARAEPDEEERKNMTPQQSGLILL